MAKAKTTARQYDAAQVASLAPPPLVRPRAESSIPNEVLTAMADAMGDGNWATNGLLYGEKEEAQRDAAKFKRQLVRHVDGVTEEAQLATRTWQDGEGFVFAVGRKPAKENAS